MAEPVYDLKITIHKADGLAAKDTNILGMRTKSDPYVKVRLCVKGPDTEEAEKIFLGKTPPVMKTLSPTWDLTFTMDFPTRHLSDDAMFELTIMDYDKYNSDDLMGVVPVYINLKKLGTTTKWYAVPASSAKGEEATGRIQVTLTSARGVRKPEEAPPVESNPKPKKSPAPVVSDPSEDDEEVEDPRYKVPIRHPASGRGTGVRRRDNRRTGRKPTNSGNQPHIRRRCTDEGVERTRAATPGSTAGNTEDRRASGRRRTGQDGVRKKLTSGRKAKSFDGETRPSR